MMKESCLFTIMYSNLPCRDFIQNKIYNKKYEPNVPVLLTIWDWDRYQWNCIAAPVMPVVTTSSLGIPSSSPPSMSD